MAVKTKSNPFGLDELAGAPPRPNSEVDILRTARAKLAAGWCQMPAANTKINNPCEFALNSLGEEVSCVHPSACAFTADSALSASLVADLNADISAALVLFRASIPDYGRFGSTDMWNDAPGRTQSDVLAAFDLAITAASPHMVWLTR